MKNWPASGLLQRRTSSSGCANQPVADGARTAFIVKGPPTYLAAEEAQHQGHFKPEQCTLFVVIPKLEAFNRTERLEAVIDPARWSEICWLRIASKNKYQETGDGNVKEVRRSFWSRLKNHWSDALLGRQVAAAWGQFDVVYSLDGAFYEHLAYRFKPRQLTLLEAGASILSRIEASGYINYWQRAGWQDQLILLLTGFRVFPRERTSLFTNYGMAMRTRHAIVANTNSLKLRLCAQQQRGGHVLWIGAPLCEYLGVRDEAYIAYIQESLQKLGLSSRELIYIAHPGKEDLTRLQELSMALGCTLDTGLAPVEVKVARGTSLPKAILSPFSSSLANLARMLPEDIEIVSTWHQQFNAIGNLMQWRRSLDASAARRIRFISVGEASPLFHFHKEPEAGEILYDNLSQYAQECKPGMHKSTLS